MSLHREKDESDTRLLYGQWVSKADIRCEAYGTIDETVSVLGLARRFCHAEISGIIDGIQKDLFTVAAELATPAAENERLHREGRAVSEAMLQRLETLIGTLQAEVPMPGQFIIPGASSTGAAALDMARAVSRRAEREIVRIKETGAVSERLLRYSNRLSTVLFLLARAQEAKEK